MLTEVGSFASCPKALAELKKHRDIDTFVSGIHKKFLPDGIEQAALELGWHICGPYGIGGLMTTCVEPHKDDIDSKLHHSLIYIPKIYKSIANMHLFAENKWHNLEEGDAVIINSDKLHAVLVTENSRWMYMSFFVSKHAKYKGYTP